MKPADFVPEVRRPFDIRIDPFVPPETGILDSPTVCVRVNGKWASHVDGVLDRLLYRDAWVGTDSEVDRAIGEIRLLLASIGAGGTLKERCAEYPASNLRIAYEPNDPFLTPDYTPPTYTLPPWYTNPAIPLPGVLPGDAMVNFLGIPGVADLPNIDIPGLLAAGFPRFRVSGIEGDKTVELHFVTVPQGGNAIITVDGGIVPVSVVELGADLTAIPAPETPGATVEEITVTGTGMHYIDVTFVPILDNEAGLPIFFGGGLRKVVICGLSPDCDEEGTALPFDVRQPEENPCILEKTEDGETWTEFADITLCLKESIVTTPSGGTAIVSDGVYTPPASAPANADPRTWARATRAGTDAEIKCLAAANASNVMWQLTERGIAEIKKYWGLSILLVLSLLLSAVFAAPWGALVIPAAPAAAALVVLSALTAGAYNSTVYREFACILYNNCTVTAGSAYFNFAAVKTAVVAKQPTFGFNVWNAIYSFLDIIGEGGLNLAGDTTAITNPCCDFCATGTNSTYLYLTAEPYFGVQIAKNAANNNQIVKNASGLRMNANGNTLYVRYDWAFVPPPGTDVVTFGFYMTNAGEPFNGTLWLNGVVVKTWTNFRPFGQFHYAQDMSLLPGVNTFILSMYNNNTTTGYFNLERVYAVYKGCDPFRDFR